MDKVHFAKPVLASCDDGRVKAFGSRSECAYFLGVYPQKVYDALDIGAPVRAADGSEWFLDDALGQ